MEVYQIIDDGISQAITREQKQSRTLACHKGCSACCKTHKDIPVYPLELVGITWYVTEKMSGDTRSTLKQQLSNYQDGGACPFLVNNACSIHFMRPFACRQFNVFGKVCAEGEDAFHTRRQDVLNPIKRFSDVAFDKTLPFYGINNKAKRKKSSKKFPSIKPCVLCRAATGKAWYKKWENLSALRNPCKTIDIAKRYPLRLNYYLDPSSFYSLFFLKRPLKTVAAPDVSRQPNVDRK